VAEDVAGSPFGFKVECDLIVADGRDRHRTRRIAIRRFD